MSQTNPDLITPAKDAPMDPNVVLIGMAGSGKTTIGQALAKRLDWAHIDTDHLLEAWYGIRLQGLRQRLGLEGFLSAESALVQELDVQRCVVSTGGSVVYKTTGMRALQNLGPIIGLEAGFETISRRIARNPERGLAIAKGQDLRQLYLERRGLYLAWSEIVVCTEGSTIASCVERLASWLQARSKRTQTPRG